MRTGSRWVAIMVTVALGAGAILACRAVTGPARTAVPTSTPSIADIERWARLKMPATAQDIHAYVDASWLDAIVVMSFKLPPRDLALFLDGAGYAERLRPPQEDSDFSVLFFYGFHEQVPGGIATPGLPWWPSDAEWDLMLQDPKRILLAGSDGEDLFSRTILVDQTNGNLYTIYLVHFET